MTHPAKNIFVERSVVLDNMGKIGASFSKNCRSYWWSVRCTTMLILALALLALPAIPILSLLGGDNPRAIHIAIHPTGEFAARFMIIAMIATPLSMLLRIAGKRALPLPAPLLYRLRYYPSQGQTGDPPDGFYDYLRYVWTLDTRRAKERLGFEPEYSTKEAWMSFVVSRRMRKYR